MLRTMLQVWHLKHALCHTCLGEEQKKGEINQQERYVCNSRENIGIRSQSLRVDTSPSPIQAGH